MNFTLSDTQQMVRDAARQLVDGEYSSPVVRAAWDNPSAAMSLWDRHLRGWTELAAGDMVDLGIFCEELGRGVVPGPFVSSAMAALVLSSVDHPRAHEVVDGGASATLAISGTDGLWHANDEPFRTHVTDADLVDLVVVVSGTIADPTVSVVTRADIECREVEQFDRLRRQYEVVVPGADGSTRAVHPEALRRGLERCWIALASEAMGVASWCLDTAVAYAKERVQFGRPIGSFQGLQWMLVDAALEVQRSSAAVSYAAMCLDADDPEQHRAVHGAKAEAGLTARSVARTALQVLGGIGYTWEHDLHFRLRRAYSLDALGGPSSWHHDQLAAMILD